MISPAVLAVEADVSDRRAVEEMFARVERDLGPVAALVNNAAIAPARALFTDLDSAGWRRLCGVDLDGAVYCCQRALPGMIRAGGGSIVNLSSVWGVQGASCEVAYSALKAGVIGLTKALAKEEGPSASGVNCLVPRRDRHPHERGPDRGGLGSPAGGDPPGADRHTGGDGPGGGLPAGAGVYHRAGAGRQRRHGGVTGRAVAVKEGPFPQKGPFAFPAGRLPKGTGPGRGID